MLSLILLIIGFVLLFKSADWLVDGASSIAHQLRVSHLVIGLTVVSFGTSSPELFVNIIASIKGNPEIAMGNILGSNIANVFLVLGVSAIIFPLVMSKGTVWKEIPFSLFAVLLLALLVNDHLLSQQAASVLTRRDGLIFIVCFILFIYYSFGLSKHTTDLSTQASSKQYSVGKACLLMVAGLVGLTIGSKWIVDGAVYIASALGVSQSFIGLTIVALGTSLPELATSAVAAFKKNPEIAVGNVVGSNIFNIFFVLGISSLIKPIPFATSNNFDIAVVVLATFLLFLAMFTGRKRRLDRGEGIIFVVLYLSYIAALIILS